MFIIHYAFWKPSNFIIYIGYNTHILRVGEHLTILRIFFGPPILSRIKIDIALKISKTWIANQS